jgi:hypothetical protein
VLSSGKNLLNLASTNFLGYITNEDIKVIYLLPRSTLIG